MAIITSWAIGVDTTANRPAAATAGRVYLPTTSGSNYLSPEYDTGAAWVKWRANIQINLWDSHAATVRTITPSTSPTFDNWGGTNQVNQMVLDFTRFSEARLIVRYGNVNALGSITMRCRDLTNSVNIGNTPSLTSASWTTDIGAWTALNASTTGDIPFCIQISAVTAGDQADVGHIALELR